MIYNPAVTTHFAVWNGVSNRKASVLVLSFMYTLSMCRCMRVFVLDTVGM